MADAEGRGALSFSPSASVCDGLELAALLREGIGGGAGLGGAEGAAPGFVPRVTGGGRPVGVGAAAAVSS